MDFSALPSYLEWANTRVLEMLQAAPDADGIGILAHLLATEQIWAARIMGNAPPCVVWPAWDLEQCAAAIGTGAEQWRGILRARSMSEDITYHNSKGEGFVSSVGDIAEHVFAHGAYHRGQISERVRHAGGEVTDMDYIFYRRQ